MPISYAQDGNTPQGKDMGVAYAMTLHARRFYKEGVKVDERMIPMEMLVVYDENPNDTEAASVIGRISYDTKGGIIISDDEHREQWHISAEQFWSAYEKMRDEIAEEDK